MEIHALSGKGKRALRDGLALAAHFVSGELPLSAAQVQVLYNAVLRHHPQDAEALIAVGLAFGEMIVAKAGYEWVRVSDEFGEETALAPLGAMIACYPISMLKRRITTGEDVDVTDLRDATIELIEAKVAGGDFRIRS